MPSVVGRVMLTIRLDRDVVAALNAIKTRDGVPVNEQVRRAVLLWLDQDRAAPAPATPAPKRRSLR
jgi:Ribbon-helix-helix protein, copG family